MKYPFTGLILLATLFTLTVSAPVGRNGGVLHHSLHHRLSRRIQGAFAERPLNLTFTPIDSVNVPIRVEYDPSTQLQTPDFRFSATLLRLGHDEEMVGAVHVSQSDVQVAVSLGDAYEGRRIMISTPDLVVRTLQQREVAQDNIPQYICQSVHVTDPNTGNQYQLVPGGNPVEPIYTDSDTIMIALDLG